MASVQALEISLDLPGYQISGAAYPEGSGMASAQLGCAGWFAEPNPNLGSEEAAMATEIKTALIKSADQSVAGTANSYRNF